MPHPNRRLVRAFTIGILAPLALARTAFTATRYVDVGLTTGANNGTSWADAYRTVDGITIAVDAAVGGDQVWVARGLYKPTTTTDRSISIKPKTGVAMYGGFASGETSLSQRDVALNVTTISGDLLGDDASGQYGDNSLHVLRASFADSTAIVDGFVVAGGNANGAADDGRGGGFWITDSEPIVRQVVFRDNRAAIGGGAVAFRGGLEQSRFTDCRFENNLGGSSGGAVDLLLDAHLRFERCEFTGNSAARGGAYAIAASTIADGLNCILWGNSSTGPDGGGAIYIGGANGPALRWCTLYGNTALVGEVGGVAKTGSASPLLVQGCILFGNTGASGSQTSANQLNGTASLFQVIGSCVQGGFSGQLNIAANPQFVNAAAGDFHLPMSSPCIDASGNFTFPGTDFDLRPRLVEHVGVGFDGDAFADMGAYELPGPIASHCRGDGNFGACPCANYSNGGGGCHVGNFVGGVLSGSGNPSIANDTFVLTCTQMIDGPCMYVEGSLQFDGGVGTPFGDGLRCIAFPFTPLGVVMNQGGGSNLPSGGPSLSALGGVTVPGSLRMYQVWFRDSESFCTSATFNMTNAIQVVWQ